jgi:hypothetical protein
MFVLEFKLKLKDEATEENATDMMDYYLECLKQSMGDADDDYVDSIEHIITEIPDKK